MPSLPSAGSGIIALIPTTANGRLTSAYYRELMQLTAEKWLSQEL
jgi:hypothetical protein